MIDWKIGDRNKSQIFILPFLGDTYRHFVGGVFPQSQFKNCFIGDNERNIDGKILLLYKFHSDLIYLNFESGLENHPQFNQRYEVDKLHTMFVFDVLNEDLDDYNLILDGNYSKISDKTKEHILKFHEINSSGDTGGILYKTDKKRTAIEETLNKDLPRKQWIKIPSDVELEEKFNMEIEKFQDKYSYKPSILPNEEFSK